MTYQEWKSLKKIYDPNTKKLVRDFELNNPGLAKSYELRHEKEASEMRDITQIPDRMERWKQIARSEYAFDPTFEARRKRETM